MFSEQERQIFEYVNWDGKKRFADPATVLRRFREYTKGQFNALIKEAGDTDPAKSSLAIEQLVGAVIYAFDIKEIFTPESGAGWLEIQLTGLCDKFNAYVNGLKKNTAATATA